MTEQAAAPSERTKRIQAFKERLRGANPPMQRVRVTPANDELRKAMKHPVTGMKFPESGSAEWPLDGFTKRRLKDGSVTREERAQRQKAPGSHPEGRPSEEAPHRERARHKDSE